jgi:hypothetical protein
MALQKASPSSIPTDSGLTAHPGQLKRFFHRAFGLATVELMQALELIVDGDQLIADVPAVIDPREAQQHGFDLCFAIDQNAALTGSGLVGHGLDFDSALLHCKMAQETVVFVTG